MRDVTDVLARTPGWEPQHARVLLVEDESPIRDIVRFHLGLIGMDCTAAENGLQALDLAARESFDVIVLDVGLPDVDGFTLCRSLRRSGMNREVPILILTARRDESDKIGGLESGADDYVTKPFGIRELLARIQALLRRPRSTWRVQPAPPDPTSICRNGLAIDLLHRRVVCDGRPISLTPYEFTLLLLLASQPGVVLDRQTLLEGVWSKDVNVTLRSVDTLVKRLRQKIERDPGEPTRVVTVWGVGYKFTAP
jgi:DNA-binding response OmpR family regulator